VVTADGQHAVSGQDGTFPNIAYGSVDYLMRHTNRLVSSFLDGHVALGPLTGIASANAMYLSTSGVTTGGIVTDTGGSGTKSSGICVSYWTMSGGTMQLTNNGWAGGNNAYYDPTGFGTQPGIAWKGTSGQANVGACMSVFGGSSFQITQSFTFGGVFSTTFAGNAAYLMSYNGVNGGNRVTMNIHAGKIETNLYTNTTPPVQLTSPTSVYADGNPHLVIVTCDMSGYPGLNMYVDGSLIASPSGAAQAIPIGSVNNQGFCIGADTGGNRFNGEVGAAFWYNSVISTEIRNELTKQMRTTFNF